MRGQARPFSGPLSYRAIPSRKKDASSPLTLVELAILRRIDRRQTYREIAAALSKSEDTVKNTVRALCRRFDTSDRAELLALPRIREELDR